MQLVKCALLENSTDEQVRMVYEARKTREANTSRVWRPTKLNSKVNAQIDLDLKFPTQAGRQGLFWHVQSKPHANGEKTISCQHSTALRR
jgi:hypothetical protein